MKVFIADDSAMFRERLKELLSEVTGIEIIGEAANVRDAIKDIRKLKPDVAIVDILMPGGNGIDTLKNIKKMKQAPVVIMITIYPYPQYRKKCMELGADYFFKKSTEFEKIIEVIEQLAENKP